MSVATQYPASAMNNPPTSRIRPPQVQRADFDSGKQSSATNRFDSHDDFYAFLDNNRGANGNGNSNSANAGLALQSALPPAHTQQQQRGTSGDHSSRPPVSNNYNAQRNTSGTSRSRPSSYTGSRSEEILIERSDNNNYKVQRQNGAGAGRRGSAQAGAGRPPTSSGGPSNTSTSAQVGSSSGGGNVSPTRHDALGGARPMSSSGSSSHDAAAAAASYGAAIQRLKTPSVMSAVLQPLDTKVREYDALAAREQDEMKRLDDEIRGLQERRAAAEARFLDAKGRHDDYQRQYQDVERALRGEAPLPRAGDDFLAGHELTAGGALAHAHTQTLGQQQPPHHQQIHGGLQRPVSFALHHETEDYSDEDDMPVQRRVHSQQSFGKTSQKMRMKERFRNSIFGSSR
jgi:hypothetical protein